MTTCCARHIRLASLVLCGFVSIVHASDTPPPTRVGVPGDYQSEAGCAGDWQPECDATQLTYDANDDVWQGAFDLPAGDWQYKAALNNAWTENYGANALRDGPNINLPLAAAARVKFYYDHKTHWIADNRTKVIAVATGSFQSELGCDGDWDPACLRAWLQDADGDGIYTFSTQALPGATYEVKVTIDESWDENYGAGGARNGANIPFTVPSDCSLVLFSYDSATHVLTVTSGAVDVPQPAGVVIAGSLQSELGCSDDWQPGCANSALALDAQDRVWQGTFTIPAGSWEYKAALNGSWDENYGQNAALNGSNISLTLDSAAAVKFYYDHVTHWVADNRTKVIATVPGSFQSELGCGGDWDPSCLRSWLQDPDGDGLYTFTAQALPAGDYEAKVAINESWDENYGQGGTQNGPNIAFSVPAACRPVTFSYNATTHVLTIGAVDAPRGDLRKARAHWVARDAIVWGDAPSSAAVRLHYAADGGLALGETDVTGGTSVTLTHDPSGLSSSQREKFPHLAALPVYRLPQERLGEVPAILKGQLAVSAVGADGRLADATSIQIPGVLDDVFSYSGPLGLSFGGGAPTLRVWAPTARAVKLHLFDSSEAAAPSAVLPLASDGAAGVWHVAGDSSWLNRYYLYEVEVFVPSTGRVESNKVSDPYSVSLSRNSRRSQIADLDDPSLEPAGWDELAKPALDAPEDIVLYELHVRDFSASDPSVAEPLRGSFRAFTLAESNGMRHLSGLARAGLTHVHLLPAFDFATVEEDRSKWEDPGDLSSFPPDSEEQQARVAAIADRDAFNWGYDPWHYNVPEGSYTTEPDGARRTLEFREMVKALSDAGLRVVMDVVYNHTTASGQSERSVLDRIVPGYYHRLNADGAIERSTCCENTATEHDMMQKLMVDSVVHWAKQYKVDGFRFDLMGHHMKRNMLAVRAALDALTPERDGVDGRKIYVYGEGWNFGEVANDARGVNAVQRNMAGTGIGSFNDRLRDGARGGGPFGPLQAQGFLTGLSYAPNGTNQGDEPGQLLLRTDWIRAGLGASLIEFPFVDRLGNAITGSALDYLGQPAGYTADPQEVINYVEAHDNETLFDAIQLKANVAESTDDRVRMQNLGVSLVGFAQGIPFFHAGVELLRSKSLDRNSYNSGDWFNRLDFTATTNNWGVGLPPAQDNRVNWDLMRPLLGNPALSPDSAHIQAAAAHFREVLQIRRSSPLFRLRTADDVKQRVRLHNDGPAQALGLIGMTLSDPTGAIDRQHDLVVVVLNANDEAQTLTVAGSAGRLLVLHPVQAASSDAVLRTASFNAADGTFSVPARTAAVFWSFRPLDAQVGWLEADVEALLAGGVLTQGRARSLLAKIQAARAQITRGNLLAARGQLGAFVNEVRALAAAGLLPAVQAEALLRAAEAILEQMP